MNYKFIICLFFTSIFLTSCAGGGTAGTGGGSELKGTIVNTNKTPLSNVTITNLTNQQADVSDSLGEFNFSIPNEGGQFQIEFNGAGLNNVIITINIPQSNGTIFAIFTGNTTQNTIIESNIRIEDRDDDSNDDDDDRNNDDDDDSNDDNDDDSNDDDSNDDSNDDDSNDDNGDDNDDDDDNSGNGSNGGNSNGNSGSGNNGGSNDD